MSKNTSGRSFGVSAALTTAFDRSGNLCVGETVAHAKRVLAHGCSTVTLFGTTGEGASLTQAECQRLVQASIAAGIGAHQLIVAVMESSPVAAAASVESLIGLGITTVLLAPPFYYKHVRDDGLFEWFSRVAAPAVSTGTRIILYHIPQVVGVAISTGLVRRLAQAFPGLFYGVKDSGGSWEYTKKLIDETDAAVLVGDERYLAAACAQGAAGSVSGMANVVGDEVSEMVQTCNDNALLHRLVDMIADLPSAVAVKALVAHATGRDVWRNVRPPLSPITEVDNSAVFKAFERLVDIRNGTESTPAKADT